MPVDDLESAATEALGALPPGGGPGGPRVVARAPARVELLGNHTDYNGGLVLAAAIDRFTVVAGRARPATGAVGRRVRVRSVQFGQDDAFDLGPGTRAEPLDPGEPGGWARYVRAVVRALGEESPVVAGFDAAVVGDVPLGAGLSSSASLEAALAAFLMTAGVVDRPDPGGDDPARLALAQTLQRAENAFVGVASGLLDQFSVLFGRAGYAVTLDCRSLAFERLPLGPTPPAVVVCDSKTSRRLADGMYNRRRAECERVVAYFQALKGGPGSDPGPVRSLRDVTPADLEASWGDLDPVGRRRARHVLTENDRVRRGAEALKAGDVAEFGRLMSASHASSRDDFENSSPDLDALIEAAEAAPGYLGGKLSGAGWAGCTVQLVEAAAAPAFAEAVAAGYARRTGVVPEVHVCHAADGASARTTGGV